MAEFELGLMRQRAQEALRQMIARGICLWNLPAGYIRTSDNRVEMTPDRQVQQAVYGLFHKFRELGSARQTLLWYVQEQVPLPRVQRGEHGQDVAWAIPCYRRSLGDSYQSGLCWGFRPRQNLHSHGDASGSGPQNPWSPSIAGAVERPDSRSS